MDESPEHTHRWGQAKCCVAPDMQRRVDPMPSCRQFKAGARYQLAPISPHRGRPSRFLELVKFLPPYQMCKAYLNINLGKLLADFFDRNSGPA